MKTCEGCADVYYDKKRRIFLIFPMGLRSSGQTLIDGPTEITAEEFDSRVNQVLGEALDSYQSIVSPDRVWRPVEGVGTFIKKHLCVSVTRLESGDLDVVPLHHEKGGYVGKEAEH